MESHALAERRVIVQTGVNQQGSFVYITDGELGIS
jgi:hypothetical protein